MPETLNPLEAPVSPKGGRGKKPPKINTDSSGDAADISIEMDSNRPRGVSSPLSPRSAALKDYEGQGTYDIFDLESDKWSVLGSGGKDGYEKYYSKTGRDHNKRKLWKKLQHKRVKEYLTDGWEEPKRNLYRDKWMEETEKKDFLPLFIAAITELIEPLLYTITLFGLSITLLQRRMEDSWREKPFLGVEELWTYLLLQTVAPWQVVFFGIGSVLVLYVILRKRLEYCVREWLYNKWLRDNVIVDWQDRKDLQCWGLRSLPFIKNLNWSGKKLNIAIFVLYVGFFGFNVWYSGNILSTGAWTGSALVLGIYVKYNKFLESSFSSFENRLISLNDAIESANDECGVRKIPDRNAVYNYAENATVLDYLHECIVVPDHLIRWIAFNMILDAGAFRRKAARLHKEKWDSDVVVANQEEKKRQSKRAHNFSVVQAMFSEATSLNDMVEGGEKSFTVSEHDQKLREAFKKNFQLNFDTINFYSMKATQDKDTVLGEDYLKELKQICTKQIKLSNKSDWSICTALWSPVDFIRNVVFNDAVERWASNYVIKTTFVHYVEDTRSWWQKILAGPPFSYCCKLYQEDAHLTEADRKLGEKEKKKKKEYLSVRTYVRSVYNYSLFLLLAIEAKVLSDLANEETRRMVVNVQNIGLTAYLNGTCSVSPPFAQGVHDLYKTSPIINFDVDAKLGHTLLSKGCTDPAALPIGTVVTYAYFDQSINPEPAIYDGEIDSFSEERGEYRVRVKGWVVTTPEGNKAVFHTVRKGSMMLMPLLKPQVKSSTIEGAFEPFKCK